LRRVKEKNLSAMRVKGGPKAVASDKKGDLASPTRGRGDLPWK